MRPNTILNNVCLLLLMPIALGAASQFVAAQARQAKEGSGAVRQILTEASRMNRLLPVLEFPAEEAAVYTKQIAQIERAAQDGRLLLSLQLLEQVEPFLVAVEYQKSKRAEVERGGMEAFEREWLRLGEGLKVEQRSFAVKSSQRLPVAVRAIIEHCLTQVRPHYQAGRLYGQNTTINAGLFYLGTALAQLQFAAFCRELRFPVSGAAISLRSLAPELDKLEKEVLQAYRNADATTQQATFNRINSALKIAQDLQQERRFGGALLQSLEVRRMLAMIHTGSEPTPLQEALKTQAESWRARLLAEKADHSIAHLYWETARALLDAPEADARDLRRASAILNWVIPAYFDYLGKGNK